MKKAVILAPYWRLPDYVGSNRMDRFVRWLSEDGYQVIMLRASSHDERREMPWGLELTVRDPLGIYRDAVPGETMPAARKPNKLRRWLSQFLLNPDSGIVWARTVAANPSVQEVVADADFILSTSPPESTHVGAWLLSKKLNRPHIVDMRDGWLDEPLKPWLRSSALRRWQEGRAEACILRDAKTILVTSDVWKELLCERYPALTTKVHVLTNGYPQHSPEPIQPKEPDEELVLLHAGRFTGSRLTQLPNLLLEPLLQNLLEQPAKGVVRLIGPLSDDELKIIETFNLRFQKLGWRIECPGSMPRDQLLLELPKANGLLLLSASHAAVPSKLFEYLPTGRPMLVVTDRDSATWRICSELPQACLVDISNSTASSISVIKFLKESNSQSSNFLIPNSYDEKHLKGILMEGISRDIGGIG